jgi:hypothetical protein
VVTVPNDIHLLRSVVLSLNRAGLHVLVFGGWAEQLHGIVTERVHRDIDLLVLDPDEGLLNDFLSKNMEVVAKASSQKRAFEVDGVLVELFLAHKDGDEYVTSFWNNLRWTWPECIEVGGRGFRLASPAVLNSYRHNWATIHAARPSSP